MVSFWLSEAVYSWHGSRTWLPAACPRGSQLREINISLGVENTRKRELWSSESRSRWRWRRKKRRRRRRNAPKKEKRRRGPARWEEGGRALVDLARSLAALRGRSATRELDRRGSTREPAQVIPTPRAGHRGRPLPLVARGHVCRPPLARQPPLRARYVSLYRYIYMYPIYTKRVKHASPRVARAYAVARALVPNLSAA